MIVATLSKLAVLAPPSVNMQFILSVLQLGLFKHTRSAVPCARATAPLSPQAKQWQCWQRSFIDGQSSWFRMPPARRRIT